MDNQQAWLYTSDLINLWWEAGKKEGLWARAIGKRHAGLSSAGAQGASPLFFFPNLLLPTTLPCQNIKYTGGCSWLKETKTTPKKRKMEIRKS
jgi:hypothetical protein